MKTKSILAALLLIVVGLQTALAQKVVVNLLDNKKVKYDVSQIESITFEEPGEHEWVDLGLPSGTLWATCNVGADNPEEYGNFFAWGETTYNESGKSSFDWSTYKYGKGSGNTMTKYCTQSDYGYNGFTDNLTELLPEDDAATTNWGSCWQMPSEEQLLELINSSNTTAEKTSQNGVNGWLITSNRNGNSIFLPAAGWRQDTYHHNIERDGSYWSRSLYSNSNSAYGLSFSNSIYTNNDNRSFGRIVRPVRVQGPPPVQLVSAIVLNETSISLQVNRTKTITATVQPSNASNKNLLWKSDNANIASVDQTGKVTAISVGSCTIVCSATDGSDVKAACQVTVRAIGTYEYVDLGLPSGTLWSACNVGADSPEEYGDYFAWGETEQKNDYLWDNYQHCKGSSYTLTKYCWQSSNGYNGYTDNKTELDPEDDAATVNWGSSWQIPSKEQMEELLYSDYVEKIWMTRNNVSGMLITSYSNGKSIFLPAGGYRSSAGGSGDISNNAGIAGDYWSRSVDTDNDYEPYYRYFYSDNRVGQELYQRFFGRNVRPVRVQDTSPAKLVTAIVLSDKSLSLKINETKALIAIVKPTDADNKAVTWKSNNEGVATVSSEGLVTAVAEGTCTIICSATDGSGVMAECKVAVVIDERLSDVIPPDIRDVIDDYIPIYDGVDPPNIEGCYYVDPEILIASSRSDDVIGREYLSEYQKYSNQNMTKNTIDMIRVQGGGIEWAKGSGAFISGSGNNFTVYFDMAGENEEVSFKSVYILSGTKTSTGIENLTFGFFVKEKGPDPNDKVVEVGTYRFFSDSDGMCESTSWPYGNQYNIRRRVIESHVNGLPSSHSAK